MPRRGSFLACCWANAPNGVASAVVPNARRNLRRVLVKRRLIQASRRVDHDYIASWFKYTPVSKPAPRKMAGVLSRTQAYRS